MGAKALMVKGPLILVHCPEVLPQKLFIFGYQLEQKEDYSQETKKLFLKLFLMNEFLLQNLLPPALKGAPLLPPYSLLESLHQL